MFCSVVGVILIVVTGLTTTAAIAIEHDCPELSPEIVLHSIIDAT